MSTKYQEAPAAAASDAEPARGDRLAPRSDRTGPAGSHSGPQRPHHSLGPGDRLKASVARSNQQAASPPDLSARLQQQLDSSCANDERVSAVPV